MPHFGLILQRRDWQAMIHYGVSFFMLEKLGAVVGVSNLHIYAAMRGQSLEDFQKKMWLKKKFVLNTNWLVTVDRIPPALRPYLGGAEEIG